MPLEGTPQGLLFHAKVVCPASRQAVALERPVVVKTGAFLHDGACIISKVASHAHVGIVLPDGAGICHDVEWPHRTIGLKRSERQIAGGQDENRPEPVAEPAHTCSCGLHSIRLLVGSSPDGSQSVIPVRFGLARPPRRGSGIFVNTIYIVLWRITITVNTYSLSWSRCHSLLDVTNVANPCHTRPAPLPTLTSSIGICRSANPKRGSS